MTILHSPVIEDRYIFRSFVPRFSLSPTLITPADVSPKQANTSIIEIQELYVDKMPYSLVSIKRVNRGVVRKLIPFSMNEEKTKAIEAFAGADMFLHLAKILFIKPCRF